MFNRSRALIGAMLAGFAGAFGANSPLASVQASNATMPYAEGGDWHHGGKRRPRAHVRCNAAALKRQSRKQKNLRARSSKK